MTRSQELDKEIAMKTAEIAIAKDSIASVSYTHLTLPTT